MDIPRTKGVNWCESSQDQFVPDMAGRFFYRLEKRPLWLRGLLGVLAGALAFGLTRVLPVRQTPYLVAYPVVILGAWMLGRTGALAVALSAGALIEFFSPGPHPPHAPVLSLYLGLGLFLLGAALVGSMTQRTAELRTREANADLRRKLEVASTERQIAAERQQASDALHERELRLNMVLEAGHVGLWDYDFQRRALLWSNEHYRMLGLEPGSVVPSMRLHLQAIHPDDRADVEQLYEETRAEGRSFCCEYRVVWPDQSVHWIETQCQYELGPEGEPLRMLGVMLDVSHRKRAEELLLRTEKLTVAGRLAAAVAHEINNPLESVSNLLYLIELSQSAEEARRYARTALAELMRVARVTQQTLKFHRQTEFARRVQISEVLDGVLALFQGRLHPLGIRVEQRLVVDPVLLCHVGDLQQVFANLISNSMDALPRGGSILIRMRPTLDEQQRLRRLNLTVADNGTGIDPQIRRRIFEPFFTTKAERGTGLGMWVVSEIVARHRGSIQVWSSRLPGRSGTVFSLCLPVHDGRLGAAIEAPAGELEECQTAIPQAESDSMR
jgi:PAS domain S-box-containing protein